MYLSYDEYIEMGGDTMEETAFNELEYEAEMQINYYTFDRLVDEIEHKLPLNVKRCVFALIKLLLMNESALQLPTQNGKNNGNALIASQSNDGVSVSYNTLSAKDLMDLTDDKAIKSLINKYLQGVRNSLGKKVLYRGLYPDE